MKECKKCGKEFTPQKGLQNYCSLTCRNSRVFSKESKEKKRIATISHWENGKYDNKKTGVTYKELNCSECGKKFSVPKWKSQKYCSLDCAYSSKEHRKKISNSIKELYEKGKKVYGGKTKWRVVKTTNGDVKVQGSYEERTCVLLDKWLIEGKIDKWEYTNDRINYINIKGEKSTYLLDFKVYVGNDYYYIETKGRVVDNDYLKWDEVRKQGHKLLILQNKELKQYGV